MASWNGNRKLVEKLVQVGLDINEVYRGVIASRFCVLSYFFAGSLHVFALRS